METQAMNRWASLLRRGADSLGRYGVIAVGVLVFAAMFYAGTLAPARVELDELKTRLVTLQQNKSSISARTNADPAVRVRAFYRSFPGGENLAPAINETHVIAGRHGLSIEQAEYQYRADASDDLAAYEMSFSVKGPYPKIRDFLLEVLRQQPSAAIDGISFRRESSSAYGVESRLRIVIFLRSKPWQYVPQQAEG